MMPQNCSKFNLKSKDRKTDQFILQSVPQCIKQKKRIEEHACEQCQGGPNRGTVHLLSVPCAIALLHQPCLLHDTKPWQDT